MVVEVNIHAVALDGATDILNDTLAQAFDVEHSTEGVLTLVCSHGHALYSFSSAGRIDDVIRTLAGHSIWRRSSRQ